MVTEAKRLASEGYTVIPLIPRSKKPAIKWREYQLKKPINEEIEKWFEDPNTGLAIITGNCSSLVVVDIDTAHGGWDTAARLGLAKVDATVITGSGGGHYYFRVPNPVVRNNAGTLGPGVDVRGEGGYVVCPPTLHERTGNPYAWQSAPRTTLPSFLLAGNEVEVGQGRELKELNGINAGTIKRHHRELYPVGKGGRNQAAARLAGSLVSRGIPRERAMQVLVLWNSDNNPPLHLEELERVWNSIVETHNRRHKR